MFEFTLQFNPDALEIRCSVCGDDILAVARYEFMSLPEANDRVADHIPICPKRHLIAEHGSPTTDIQGVDTYDIPLLDELQQETSEGQQLRDH